MADLSGLFGRSASNAPPQDPQVRKQQIMNEVSNQMAMANAQELVNKLNEKCYEKCITRPSTSLSSSEETCLARCMDRFLESFNVVSRTYVARMARERDAQQLAAGSVDDSKFL
ncbi:uncharacterized protein L969DRAFT_76538 [Mixia osmundae IAM 14324]|uniref:Mitochondrial import inner membrane translocase subunit n=1 Tax=Mixia osmundae (strain CBS 9802 / IAM 14324 / JCM 22182 / KY 12970) TaxID=764103 RepID=G7E7J4_MIXOS|nr:uncharacterized protein L969DRAFT_76538 [Mixia osmundae IAM 14324]KEI38406.1 hypothetical protein L969DRAFT_76538 [Mixia osmundae IAM 14324]GAA98804.1 hypothetical protein E5Q_05492 [Mixia osmundae IAM 14324]